MHSLFRKNSHGSVYTLRKVLKGVFYGFPKIYDAISLHAYMTTGSLYFDFIYVPYKTVVNRNDYQIHVATWTMCVGGGEADDQKEVKKISIRLFCQNKDTAGKTLTPQIFKSRNQLFDKK